MKAFMHGVATSGRNGRRGNEFAIGSAIAAGLIALGYTMYRLGKKSAETVDSVTETTVKKEAHSKANEEVSTTVEAADGSTKTSSSHKSA